MTRTIWKYQLELTDGPQEHAVPKAAILLLVAEQYGKPTMWFEVWAEAEKIPRAFYVVGTGHEIPADGKWLGSLQMPPFVWHVYEV